MPRRTLLTEEVQKAICEALRLGTPIDVMCEHVSISTATYHRWNDRGRAVLRQIETHAEMYPDGFEPLDITAQDLAYAEFAEETTKARASAHVRSLGIIHKAAAEGNWQAAAWYLERTQPKTYARRNGDRIDTLERERDRDPSELPTVTEERREAIILKLKDYLPDKTG